MHNRKNRPIRAGFVIGVYSTRDANLRCNQHAMARATSGAAVKNGLISAMKPAGKTVIKRRVRFFDESMEVLTSQFLNLNKIM